jgi:hypothetical protein
MASFKPFDLVKIIKPEILWGPTLPLSVREEWISRETTDLHTFIADMVEQGNVSDSYLEESKRHSTGSNARASSSSAGLYAQFSSSSSEERTAWVNHAFASTESSLGPLGTIFDIVPASPRFNQCVAASCLAENALRGAKVPSIMNLRKQVPGTVSQSAIRGDLTFPLTPKEASVVTKLYVVEFQVGIPGSDFPITATVFCPSGTECLVNIDNRRDLTELINEIRDGGTIAMLTCPGTMHHDAVVLKEKTQSFTSTLRRIEQRIEGEMSEYALRA